MSNLAIAQSGFPDWDSKYPFIEGKELIRSERAYAKKVEADTTQPPYYTSLRKIRLFATFTGKMRPLNKDVEKSMRRVFQLRMGNSNLLNGLIEQEAQFSIAGETHWMPIQKQLVAPLKEEVKPGEKVLLYALFVNEHTYHNVLYCSFLISEFTSEWE
jgi:hypothetical protein